MAIAKFSNIEITIEDYTITVDHSKVIKLSIDRVVSDAANKFSISLLDDAAYQVERKLIQGNNEITISYFDDTNTVRDTFRGNITKLNSSFINDRSMLTIEGYVGISIPDKYQLKSRNWNKAVVFDWKDIFDDWDNIADTNVDNRSKWEIFWSNFFNHKETKQERIDKYNNSFIEKACSIIRKDEIYQDDEGNFYTYSKKEKTKGEVVKGTEVILPVRPHKILKLLCDGGTLDGLLEDTDSSKSYKGCDNFINLIDSRGNAAVDLAFIREFLKKHDKIEPHSWVYNESRVTPTKLVECDMCQNTTSDTKYIYEVLCNKSLEDSGTADTYNYSFMLDNNMNVTFKPIQIDADAKPKARFNYYGLSDYKENESDAQLVSFSADTNFLTAFLTGDMSNLDNMSKLNLVTGEEMDSSILAKTEDKLGKEEGKYKYSYKTTSFAPVTLSGNSDGSQATWLRYWQEAAAQTYKAEANIVGYSGLAPGDYVDITVIPKPGLYHHTSGLYFIQKLTDTIENGVFKTKLTLIKNVATMGNSSLNKYKK